MEQKLGSCCLSGYAASGEPKGEIITLAGVQTYIAKPKEGTSVNGRAVVIATDVFGLGLVNNKLLADTYAEKGNFLVAVPDLFNGQPVPPWIMDKFMLLNNKGPNLPTSTIGSFFAKAAAVCSMIPHFIPFMMRNKESAKMPIVENVITELKTSYGATKIGVAGFCYGGYFALNLAKLEDKIDAFVTAHTGVKVPEDVVNLKKPGLFLCPDNDFAFPEEKRVEAEALLSKRADAANFRLKVYTGVYHGFAVRGDAADAVVEAAREDASKEAVEWFQTYLR